MFYAEFYGTTRNFFLFFEPVGSLCFAQAAECGGTRRRGYRIRSGVSRLHSREGIAEGDLGILAEGNY